MKFQYGPQNWYQAISCNIWNDQDLSPPCKENRLFKKYIYSKLVFGNWYQAISCNIWNNQDLSPSSKENRLFKKNTIFQASFWVIFWVIFFNSYVLENSRAGIASNALPIQMARMVPITIYLEVLLFKGQTIALYLKYI